MKGPTGELGNIRGTAWSCTTSSRRSPSRPGRGAEGVAITIEASNDLTYAKLIETMDLCKKAGYDSVNLTPTKGH